jgi:NADPH-dependent glutamate synthase beta chain and related oxidoreductases
MLTLGIPEFRLEKKIINAEIDILKELGVEFKTGVEIGKAITIAQLREEGYKAFYLAIGAQLGSKLGIPGEDLKGVYSGIEFLRDVNLGKKVELGEKVAVIGGGNVAVDVARTAARLGSKVTVIYRRKEEDMPADPEEVAEAKAEGVEFLFEHKPLEIEGKAKVTGLKCENDQCKVNSVIAAIGQKIDLTGFDVATGEKGNVIADAKTYQTSESDIFAGGDVVTGPKFAIDAIAAGKEAAVSIHRYVHAGQTLINGRDPRDYKPLDTKTVAISPRGFDNTPRQRVQSADVSKAMKTFEDLRGTLTEEQIKKEANRCIGCGCAVIDEDLCVGCGICTTKCKFDAITLEKTLDNVGTPYFKTLLTMVGNVPATAGRLVRKKLGK